MNENITAAAFAAQVSRKRDALQTRRANLAAVLVDPERIPSDFDLAELVEISAKQAVLGTLDEHINRLLDEGKDDAVILQMVIDRFESAVTTTWQPNSTSNVSVEVDLKKHFYNIQVLNVLRGIGFGGI